MAGTDREKRRARALLKGRRAARGDVDRAPSTPTMEIQREICDRLRVGIPIRFAAMAAHVALIRVEHWYEAGDRDRGLGYHETPLARFADAVDVADAEYVSSAIARIRVHGAQDWRAEAWLLERRHPLQFGRERSAAPPPEEEEIEQRAGGRTIVVIGKPSDAPARMSVEPGNNGGGNGNGHL